MIYSEQFKNATGYMLMNVQSSYGEPVPISYFNFVLVRCISEQIHFKGSIYLCNDKIYV